MSPTARNAGNAGISDSDTNPPIMGSELTIPMEKSYYNNLANNIART